MADTQKDRSAVSESQPAHGSVTRRIDPDPTTQRKLGGKASDAGQPFRILQPGVQRHRPALGKAGHHDA